MRLNAWLFVDKVRERVTRYYHKRTFLSRIGQRKPATTKCTILGKVHVNATNVSVGRNVTIYPGVYFWGDGEIVIGDNCDIGIGTVIFASKQGGVRIGSNVSIAAYCYLIDSNHGMCRETLIQMQPIESQPVAIGDDVWIGAHCAVIKGAKICRGAVIGAGAVVNSEIPEYSIAVGTPARVVRERG